MECKSNSASSNDKVCKAQDSTAHIASSGITMQQLPVYSSLRQLLTRPRSQENKLSESKKIEIKPEICWLHNSLGEEEPPVLNNWLPKETDTVKNGTVTDTNIEIKNEPICHESEWEEHPVSNPSLQKENHKKTDIKTEIKEEPFYSETASNTESSFAEEKKDSWITGMDDLWPAESPRLQTEAIGEDGSEKLNCLETEDASTLCETTIEYEVPGNTNEELHVEKHSYLLNSVQHVCEHCGKCFTSSSELRQHNSIHEAEEVHKCNICDKTFRYVSRLKEHSRHHEILKPYKCDICEKSFILLLDLRKHSFVHEPIRPYKCDICAKSFKVSSSLKKHSYLHEGAAPYKCEICSKSFVCVSHLKDHRFRHEDIRPHKCEICQKGFKVASDLKKHALIHKDSRPHSCEICHKSFKFLSTLKTHVLIHEDSRPFKCDICHNSFKLVSALRRHCLIHETRTVYQCQVCDKTYSRESLLKQHSLIHESQ